MCRLFAQKGADRFAHMTFRPGRSGAPILDAHARVRRLRDRCRARRRRPRDRRRPRPRARLPVRGQAAALLPRRVRPVRELGRERGSRWRRASSSRCVLAVAAVAKLRDRRARRRADGRVLLAARRDRRRGRRAGRSSSARDRAASSVPGQRTARRRWPSSCCSRSPSCSCAPQAQRRAVPVLRRRRVGVARSGRARSCATACSSASPSSLPGDATRRDVPWRTILGCVVARRVSPRVVAAPARVNRRGRRLLGERGRRVEARSSPRPPRRAAATERERPRDRVDADARRPSSRRRAGRRRAVERRARRRPGRPPRRRLESGPDERRGTRRATRWPRVRAARRRRPATATTRPAPGRGTRRRRAASTPTAPWAARNSRSSTERRGGGPRGRPYRLTSASPAVTRRRAPFRHG